MGPGRLTPTKEQIDWREQLRLRGVYYVGSCPNATSVNAEMDNQFGSYKGACRLSTQRCYNGILFDRMEKIRIVPKTCSLTPGNLPMITNRKIDEPVDRKLFDKVFTKERNLKAWSNIGFVPFTRKSLQNKIVCRELHETKPEDNKLEILQMNYEETKIDLKSLGFNEDAFNAEIPKAFIKKRKEGNKDQIKQLIENGKIFLASGIFLHTANMVFNSKNVIKAKRQALETVEDTQTRLAEDK